MLAVFNSSVRNDLRVMVRSRAEWLQSLVFFAIFISLFGIGIGFDTELVKKISPAILWIAFLITSLFTIEAIFRSDLEEGILEQLVLSPYPLWWLILAKSCAIWIVASLPLILLIPILGLSMQLAFSQSVVLLLSLLLGSPALTSIGIIGAALTIGLPRSGIFLGILLLPLYVPVLILGGSTIESMQSTGWPVFQLSLLAGISTLTLTLAPHAAAAALRVAME